ncbi:FAD-dependent oxidoreductase [Nocardia callitridis]|uniref:NAD(P)/FAD-dependent oxidoreductase n=1 Tax=Nocardia callitridis TaxID=648753 RepID=A0ABP9JWH5_9NOCA
MNATARALPATTSVVIVGAGPVGLTAAVRLADAGVDFVLIDRIAEGANTSRAAVVHAKTLEVLSELGIADELIETGLRVPTFTLHDGRKKLAAIKFDRLPTRFPYALLTPQDVTESVLLQRLRKAGGEPYRPYTVTGVVNENDGVTVEYTDTDGAEGTLRADYVIAADGSHSPIREQLAVGFDGGTYPASFVLADVRMDWPIGRDEVALHLSPAGFLLVAPLPDERADRYRVVATMDNAPEHPTVAHVQSLVDERGPGAGTVTEVLWGSRFRVHHRLAAHYRAGRVFLAGDAAHVHSPAGGQGMNTGVQDAATLGALLARVIANGESPTILDEYERTRRPVARGVVRFTDFMTKAATTRSPLFRHLRNRALPLLASIPAFRNRLAHRLAELD